MTKIAFMGAGSTVFVRSIIGDCMCLESLRDAHFALYDIDPERLVQSAALLGAMNRNFNNDRATITTHCGVRERKTALRKADFVVNAIQVGGYIPSTQIDFEVPKRFGLRQTIGDTLGIGGIFRALRTIPVMLDFAHDMEAVAPDAWLLNYTNPMAMLTGAMLRGTGVKTVGLCHSVQACVGALHRALDLEWSPEREKNMRFTIAGINHMSWLLNLSENGRDLYPGMRKLAVKKLAQWRHTTDAAAKSTDMVRLEMMNKFGYYITESSEHNAEYTPYWIKAAHPELIAEYNIPLDEYPRRCVNQIAKWQQACAELSAAAKTGEHKMSNEYGSRIMNAVVTGTPTTIGGNVLNHGLIDNLPAEAVVEVPCFIDGNGVHGTAVGALPPQCAALNMTNINVQLLTIAAALTGKKEHIYHAAMLDPHTSSELVLDDIVKLCDALIAEHGTMLPQYR